MLRVIISVLLLISSIWALSGCSSGDKKADTPEGAYQLAQEFDKDERYEEAIKRYQDIKNKFPYSKYATMSELAVADAYFKQESYAEAQVAYQAFKDLHPKHAKIDYVTFRLALSFYNQLPPTTDRDLTLSQSAILYFDEVINQFPNSEFVGEARDKKAATLKMLAEKENYIAEFYFIREKYDSALGRYEGLLRKYPGLGFDAQALSHAAVSAAKAGEPDKAKRYLADLQKRFPGSDELQFAKEGIK
jgi:outer membrane protein assembly factor BamD